MNIHTIQLNIANLEGGTRHMDATEFGAYMSLLIACYQDKDHCLLDDNARLARMAKCSSHKWKKIRPVIEEKFKVFEKNLKKYWSHSRIEKDVEKYKNLSEQNAKNAAKRWQSKDSNKKDVMRPALRPHNEPQSDSQCDRNATKHQTPIITELLTPPYPLEKPKQKKSGSLKTSFKGEGVTVDNIMVELDDEALALCRKNAPEWDIYYLANVYITGINDETRPPPRNVKKAFPAWCGGYTKGKTP
jgi:uncharacterized protein YdaU (DUF1376 family)